MNASEKLILLAKAISGDEKVEKSCGGVRWDFLMWDEHRKLFQSFDCTWSILELLHDSMEIRSIPQLPKLTDEEKDWLKYHPDSWYLCRDKDGSLSAHCGKPFKNTFAWTSQVSEPVPFAPSFTGIKWSDDDCFTIGELRNQK